MNFQNLIAEALKRKPAELKKLISKYTISLKHARMPAEKTRLRKLIKQLHDEAGTKPKPQKRKKNLDREWDKDVRTKYDDLHY